MNERTHLFIKIYLSHFILERVDVGCVWEVSWRRGQTATYWPKVLLAIAALLSHLGGVAQPLCLKPKPSVWSPSPLSEAGSHSTGILSPTDSSRLCPGYILFAVHLLPLIYTGASLDWRLGRGSICNIRIMTMKQLLSPKTGIRTFRISGNPRQA